MLWLYCVKYARLAESLWHILSNALLACFTCTSSPVYQNIIQGRCDASSRKGVAGLCARMGGGARGVLNVVRNIDINWKLADVGLACGAVG